MKNTVANSTYTQAGVSCYVGQESAKFEMQYFVESSVLKNPCLRVAAKRCALFKSLGFPGVVAQKS